MHTYDSRTHLIPAYNAIKEYTNSLNSPNTLLYADILETLHTITTKKPKTVLIITPNTTLIAYETTHLNHPTLFVTLAIGYISDLKKLAGAYIYPNSPWYIQYFHQGKFHFYPMKKLNLLEHTSTC